MGTVVSCFKWSYGIETIYHERVFEGRVKSDLGRNDFGQTTSKACSSPRYPTPSLDCLNTSHGYYIFCMFIITGYREPDSQFWTDPHPTAGWASPSSQFIDAPGKSDAPNCPSRKSMLSLCFAAQNWLNTLIIVCLLHC